MKCLQFHMHTYKNIVISFQNRQIILQIILKKVTVIYTRKITPEKIEPIIVAH